MRKLYLIALICCLLPTLAAIPAEQINHKVTLKWLKPVGNYDGFNVYRQDCNGNYILLKTLGKVLTITDPAVIGGQKYTYYVKTLLQGKESNPSVIAFTTVPY